MDLKKYLNEKKGLVESALCDSVNDEAIPKPLCNAMRYSLEAGGKRLRPILVIAGAEAVGGNSQKVMNAAVALEMIHTFSLIHDDLPSMDNDSLRRGKPANHKVFGEAGAILAGDGLLAEAFYLLAQHVDGVDPKMALTAVRDIALATGGRGMTGGQVIDMEATGKKIDVAGLKKLHAYKTGALISVSVTTGAKLCGASENDINNLSIYGDCIGLAFQIADDILDIEGDEATLGKDIGSDESKGKSTYPSVIGMDASKSEAALLVDQAVATLSMFGSNAEPLRSIAKYIVERRG